MRIYTCTLIVYSCTAILFICTAIVYICMVMMYSEGPPWNILIYIYFFSNFRKLSPFYLIIEITLTFPNLRNFIRFSQNVSQTTVQGNNMRHSSDAAQLNKEARWSITLMRHNYSRNLYATWKWCDTTIQESIKWHYIYATSNFLKMICFVNLMLSDLHQYWWMMGRYHRQCCWVISRWQYQK